jgi:hypothetical protein
MLVLSKRRRRETHHAKNLSPSTCQATNPPPRPPARNVNSPYRTSTHLQTPLVYPHRLPNPSQRCLFSASAAHRNPPARKSSRPLSRRSKCTPTCSRGCPTAAPRSASRPTTRRASSIRARACVSTAASPSSSMSTSRCVPGGPGEVDGLGG